MIRKCRFCGAEISYGEKSTAAICPKCGALNFSSASPRPLSKHADTSGANNTSADLPADLELTKRIEAWKQKEKKRKKLLASSICFAVLLCVAATIFYVRILPVLRYRKALDALENGDYSTAFVRFDELNGFRDADEKRSEAGICLLADAQVGDTILFGQFDQDNDPSNGKENIQWRVLEREQDRLLLITQSVLDAVPYNEAEQDTTWETCSLREWLNNSFLVTAFTKTEQHLLQSTELSAQVNPLYPTDPGSNTTDRVFLLGIEDVQLYFGDSDSERIAVATKYAIQRNIVVNETTGGSPWWVRSPGYEGNLAAFVRSDGKGNADGTAVNTMGCGVRPVVWLDLSQR